MNSEKKDVKDNRKIKEIADDIFGITLRTQVDEVLDNISDEQLDSLRKTTKGKKIAKRLEKLKGSAIK